MKVNVQLLKRNVLDRFSDYLEAMEMSSIDQIQELQFESIDYRTPEGTSTLLKEISTPDIPVIYKLDIITSLDKENLVNTYRAFHEKNKTLDRGIDRLNVSRFNDTGSNTLYVGSKMKNLRARIRQHLGGGNFRTFGLHLNKWDGSLSYQLNLEILRVNLEVGDQYQRVLTEFFEQELWEQSQPIFGKKSGL